MTISYVMVHGIPRDERREAAVFGARAGISEARALACFIKYAGVERDRVSGARLKEIAERLPKPTEDEEERVQVRAEAYKPLELLAVRIGGTAACPTCPTSNEVALRCAIRVGLRDLSPEELEAWADDWLPDYRGQRNGDRKKKAAVT